MLEVQETTTKSLPKENANVNIIAANTKIEGTIIVENDLILDGEVEGNINGNGASKVIIGSSGVLKGILTCENAEINGRVLGSLVISNKLTIKEKAFISGGDIKVKTLIVEPEAIINANCTMRNETINEPKLSEEVKSQSESTENINEELEKNREKKWHNLI